MTTLPTWKQHPDLMARLTAAQNALTAPIDIMTFAGMCSSREELQRHVEHYDQRNAAQSAATRDFLYWAYARGERPGFAIFKVRRVDGRLVNGEPERWFLTVQEAEDRCATLNRALAVV